MRLPLSSALGTVSLKGDRPPLYFVRAVVSSLSAALRACPLPQVNSILTPLQRRGIHCRLLFPPQEVG